VTIAVDHEQPRQASEERPMTTDQPIFARINDLAHEEEALFQRAGDGGGLDGGAQRRLEEIQVELDQCYDILHQRQARRAAGLDPDEAAARSPKVVEGYEQ
jgi:Protein of unknown function (DUF2630)